MCKINSITVRGHVRDNHSRMPQEYLNGHQIRKGVW